MDQFFLARTSKTERQGGHDSSFDRRPAKWRVITPKTRGDARLLADRVQRRVRKSPTATAATPRTTCPAALKTAAPHRPCPSRDWVSSPKAEKVVKPPRIPVARNRRAEGAIHC